MKMLCSSLSMRALISTVPVCSLSEIYPCGNFRYLHIRLYNVTTHFYALELCLITDKFGNTPLLEAVKQGHDRVATLLFTKGAKLNLKNAGSHLCMAVSK